MSERNKNNKILKEGAIDEIFIISPDILRPAHYKQHEKGVSKKVRLVDPTTAHTPPHPNPTNLPFFHLKDQINPRARELREKCHII